MIKLRKPTKNGFKGMINRACHEFTLGKQTKDVEVCIEILENKIEQFKEFLHEREKRKEASESKNDVSTHNFWIKMPVK